MKLPNGYGSVTKLTGNRRKPYMARVTTSIDEFNVQTRLVIGYFAKRTEALAALTEYHQRPFDPATRKLTLQEVYDKYTQQRWLDSNESIPHSYTSAIQYAEKLLRAPFVDIKTNDMQKVINSCEKGYSTKKNIKVLFNLLSKWALANDIATKNYAALTTLPEYVESRKHTPFTEEELKTLWAGSADPKVQDVLILCYTGMRPTEFLKIKRENVFLDKEYMMGGIKTAAGKNRLIPIAKKIKPFIERLFNEGHDYLIEDEDGLLNYDKYRDRIWNIVMNRYKLNHLPHDGRHTCATLMDNADVNDTIKKLILGHAGGSITQRVYTHKTIEQLIEAINTI